MSSRPKKPSPGSSGAQKLRIIGGRWRSRALAFPVVEGLRPTGNRIRETLFNWLMPELLGSRCLDLFAGSGILGFEALSRGAAYCTFVESNAYAARQLKSNAALLQTDDIRVVHGSALDFLKQAPQPADLVFLDPPFAAQLWQPALTLLEQGWLRNGALVYIESPMDASIDIGSCWHPHRQKQAGHVCYSLYRYESPLSSAL